MDELVSVAVQVPGMAIIGGVFLYVIRIMLDFFREQRAAERELMQDAVDAVREAASELRSLNERTDT